MRYAVCVAFEIKPEFIKEFLPMVYANAKASLEKEDGCLLFDVCTDANKPNEVFLYELYTSEYGFELHLKTEHFLLFNDKVAHMICDKQVNTYSTVV